MVKLVLGVIALSLICCDGRPKSNWPLRPQFRVGDWEVYHPTDFSIQERNWVRISVAEHIRISETYLLTPRLGGLSGGVWVTGKQAAVRWWFNKNPNKYITPKIYIYGRKVNFLNSPVRVGVRAYADFKEEKIHCVMGNKLSLPGLAIAVHQLRGGPDLWHQDASLLWPAVFQKDSELVLKIEKNR